MKTVIDAVNEFNGDLDSSFLFNERNDTHIFYDKNDDSWVCDEDAPEAGGEVKLCTIKEFNECLEWCENWQSELNPQFNGMTYDEFCDFKDNPISNLVYDKDGYGYEVDKTYITHGGNIAVLHEVDCDDDHFILKYYDGGGRLYSPTLRIDERYTTGTITPPKVKLVDGQAYMFEYKRAGKCLGFFHKDGDIEMFILSSDGGNVMVRNCTNIIPLVKG